MEQISFIVEGVPVAKGRPRFSSVGKFVKTYTPKKTLDYERKVFNVAVQHRESTPYLGPIQMSLLFLFPRPKRLANKVDPGPHMTKPDIDNLCKSVIDAIVNAQIIKDDTQISHLTAAKGYVEFNLTPRVVVDMKKGFGWREFDGTQES